ncbi:MAG: restriction endonuclease, partial [Rhizomicrobium sp.]
MAEIIGVKAGVALSRRDIDAFFAEIDEFSEYACAEDEDYFRIESIVYQSMVEGLLYKLGRLERPVNHLPGVRFFHAYKREPELHKIAQEISRRHLAWMKSEIERIDRGEGERMLDPTPLLEGCFEAFGAVGGKMALELLDDHIAYETARIDWFGPEESEWENVIELKSLFDSEKLDAHYGNFFDQRFIDYLNRNFSKIDQINWRKFEQLSAEFFDRAGFSVQLGSGRNDDGIDIRAWKPGADVNGPAQLIVQCKRQKAAVEKVIVKALYADVQNENAESGMIVTTSRLSPGSKATCRARHYPILVSDRS